jgi:hypothetical protein
MADGNWLPDETAGEKLIDNIPCAVFNKKGFGSSRVPKPFHN